MKRLLALTLASMCLIASAANADTYLGTFALTTAEEVPAPVLGAATPSGSATVSLNDVAMTLTVDVTYSGLTSNNTLGHIHGPAAVGATASPLFNFATAGPLPGGTSGSFSRTFTGLSAVNVQRLKDGLTYVNLHTVNNGSGEIRGQVLLALVHDTTQTPAMSRWGLVALAVTVLGVAGLVVRRRFA